MTSKNFNKGDSMYVINRVWFCNNHAYIFKDANMIIQVKEQQESTH